MSTIDLTRYRQITGWVAVGLSTAITGLWAFWGINETFHEGWYYRSFWQNMAMTLAQYLSPVIIFLIATLVTVFRPRAGSILHVILGIFAWWFFGFLKASFILIFLPMVVIGLMYWFGRPQPQKRAALIVVVVTSLILIGFAVEPIYRINTRVFDNNPEARLVEGNGLKLIWAPGGPGWPQEGTSWFEAGSLCSQLLEDGKNLAGTPQNLWRLPTIDEAVRSMSRHGSNSGGVWDAAKAKATYQVMPDKESPLWNTYSPIIYWWTSSEVDGKSAYSISYNGRVVVRTKKSGYGSLSFRCVREVK